MTAKYTIIQTREALGGVLESISTPDIDWTTAEAQSEEVVKVHALLVEMVESALNQSKALLDALKVTEQITIDAKKQSRLKAWFPTFENFRLHTIFTDDGFKVTLMGTSTLTKCNTDLQYFEDEATAFRATDLVI